MPTCIQVISKHSDFVGEVKRALDDAEKIDHRLIVTEDLNGPGNNADILIIDDKHTFSEILPRLEKLVEEDIDEPTIILVADRDTIANAVTANFCSPLTIQYLIRDDIEPSLFNNCIRHAVTLTDNRRARKSDQKHYRSLFDHVPDPAFILNEDEEFVKVNNAFEAYFDTLYDGKSPSNLKDLFKNLQDYEEITERIQANPKKGIKANIQLGHPNGRKSKLVRIQLAAIQGNSELINGAQPSISGFNGSFRDITEEKLMEDFQTRIDNLAMTYRLTRSLAHEIRNPLTNVTLALDQLKDEMGETVDDEGTTLYFGIIDRSIKRIESLIEQLLKGAEKKQLSLQDTDIVALSKEVVLENIDRMKLREINLTRNFEQEEFVLPLDQEQIKLAISNLVTNAIEAIDNKEDGCITIGSCVEDGHFYLFVEDNGYGIPSDMKDNLFTPFFTSKKKGIGFGLTSTQTILAEHGAFIDVESEEGKGSIFSIGFPLKVKPESEPSE